MVVDIVGPASGARVKDVLAGQECSHGSERPAVRLSLRQDMHQRKIHVKCQLSIAILCLTDWNGSVGGGLRTVFFFAARGDPARACVRFHQDERGQVAMNKVPMTMSGFAKLKEELRWRQQEERPRIIEAIAEARSHGDLSENAEYHAAKEAQSHNEGRIAELEDLIARAEVIDVSKLSGETIKFGATVVLIDEDTEEKKTYQIVGDMEADVKSGRISISSPIARALIGKGVGDAIEVNAPGGAHGYEIVKVQYI
jgi:transcription elongation factor GreA